MNNILIIYNGWKIKKFTKKCFAAVSYTAAGKEVKLSKFMEELEDVFSFCDSIDLEIEYYKK